MSSRLVALVVPNPVHTQCLINSTSMHNPNQSLTVYLPQHLPSTHRAHSEARVRRDHSVADICDRNAAGACRSPRSVGTTARSATADNQHRRSPASHGDARSSGPTDSSCGSCVLFEMVASTDTDAWGYAATAAASLCSRWSYRETQFSDNCLSSPRPSDRWN